jgi:hypothetical protein
VAQFSSSNIRSDPPEYVNLLTNAGFGVWSNSTLENVGSAILEDDCSADNTGDWNITGDSLTFDTDHYEFAASAVNKEIWDSLILEGGKIYKISIDVKDGTASSQTFNLRYWTDGDAGFSPTYTTTGSWVTYTWVFQSNNVGTSQNFKPIYITSNPGGNNVEIKNISIYEVTPGCIAADALGLDGWTKDSTLDIYREHNGSNTKKGEFYSLKMVPTAQDNWVYWPKDINDQKEHLERFSGRTVTTGAWIKSSTANDIRIRIQAAPGRGSSSYHSGGGDWEWLEVTYTVPTDNTQFYVQIQHGNASPGTAYISQPMLIFGSSIGEGNYVPQVGEIIYFEDANIILNSYNTVTVSVNTVICLESESNGKIPKGIKALKMQGQGQCGTVGKALSFGKDTTNIWDLRGYAQVAVKNFAVTGWVPADSDGNIAVSRNDTIAGVIIRPLGVQLR